MIFVVSTVKDTRANLELFVERNLRAGADHLFLFLDAPDTGVEEWLTGHPHVTHVVCDESYWVPERFDRLNARQVTNANLISSVLACFDWADWLFHLDADESLQIDRDRLEAEVPPEVRVVKLAPLEAISQLHPRPDIRHFKRRLNRTELARLQEAGVLSPPEAGEPINSRYFRGHLMGKVGVRPGLDHWMQLHRVVWCGPAETELPDFRAEWLQHRHYESVDGAEFIRKWKSHLAAGEIRLRPRRRQMSADIAAIVADESLDEAGQTAALTRIYTEQVQDPYDDLLAAGVLELPVDHDYTPRPFPPGAREELDAVLAQLVTADKRYANPRITDLWPRDLLEVLAEDCPDDDVAALLEGAVQKAVLSERTRGASRRSPGRGRWKSALQRVARGLVR